MAPSRLRGLLCALACGTLIALGCWHLRFDVDVLNLLPRDLPAAAGIQLYQTNFANAKELLISVQANDAEDCETATRSIATHLASLGHLVTDVVWQPLWMERPSDSAEFIAYSWLNQPPPAFSNLCGSLSISNLNDLLQESREALATSFSPETVARRSYDPLRLTELPSPTAAQPFGDGSRLFASADGRFHLIFVKAAVDLSDYRRCTIWLNEVKAEVQRHLAESPNARDVIVRYTGRPAFVSEISSGMQSDLAGPSALTLGVIAALFYWTHRRIKPLLWLVALLLVILAGTCAVGGLLFGALNIVSFGFASILLGLAEDFGVVLYEEARSHAGASAAQVRAVAAPGILWSTVTTCSAFLALNLAGLPGLGQLGTLVAVGVALAAVVMLFAYLPPLMRGIKPRPIDPPAVANRGALPRFGPLASTIALLVCCAAVLLVKRPPFDNSPAALRPKKSQAYVAADEIKVRMDRTREPLWVLITGSNETDVSGKLRVAERELLAAVSNNLIAGVTLPTAVWPNADHQRANASAAKALLLRRDAIQQAMFSAGFTTNATALAERVFNTWSVAAESVIPFWPTNQGSRWIMDKFTARSPGRLLALGLIEPPPDDAMAAAGPGIAQLSDRLVKDGIYVSGWELLGSAVFARVRHDFWRVLIPMVVLVLVSLWLAFRSMIEVVLCIATLLVGGVVLWAVMAAAGWSWNLLNLMAIPLLLGMGVDFAIHIQLALRRTNGDLRVVKGSIGRALLLAASTTVAGFASLALSNNAGMASLGKVCGAGIAIMVAVSVYLLPHWWTGCTRSRR